MACGCEIFKFAATKPNATTPATDIKARFIACFLFRLVDCWVDAPARKDVSLAVRLEKSKRAVAARGLASCPWDALSWMPLLLARCYNNDINWRCDFDTRTFSRPATSGPTSAGTQPLRLIDPDTNTVYVLVRAEVFDQVQAVLHEDESELTETYTARSEPRSKRAAATRGWTITTTTMRTAESYARKSRRRSADVVSVHRRDRYQKATGLGRQL